MKRKKRIFCDTLKSCLPSFVSVGLSLIGSGSVFYLYSLPSEALIYAAVLAFVFEIVFFGVTYKKEFKKAKTRERMICSALTDVTLPPAETIMEKDYQTVIRLLQDELIRLQNSYESAEQEEIDYYTAWVHQIKTPIAVMRMQLGNEQVDTGELETELFRIEQYVDMVLTFIRLGSGSTDLVIREYSLDELIRETIRKFAPQFIHKKLRLCYDGTDKIIVTDKKWFCCILEQLLSNAIKYTPEGHIEITESNGILQISDTGIGIAPEDIPRIFEKGFTGKNGRFEKHSSGLGLYLCKKAADLLSVPLSVQSVVGTGSKFSLNITDHHTK